MAQPKKFSPMRFTAATESAAVAGALQLVGATRDDIDYDVLDESAKGVTVRIRPHDAEAAPPAAATPTATPQPEIERSQTDDASEANEDEAPLHIDSVRELDSDDGSDDEMDFDASLELDSGEYDSDEDEEDDELDNSDLANEVDSDEDDSPEDEAAEPEEVGPVDPEVQARALDLARAFLDKLGLEAEVVSGPGARADSIPLIIEGEDVGILIGKHGATLQSFQYLLNITLNQNRDLETEGVRVTVDAGNYRARRQESLEVLARGAAQRARREGTPIRMEPMPANERRIVHSFLQSEPGIVTQSEGREPHRCIVVAPGRNSGHAPARGGNNGGRGMGGYTRGRGGRGGRR